MANGPQGEVGLLTEWQGVERKDVNVQLDTIDEQLKTFLRIAGLAHVVMFSKPVVVTSGRDGNHVASSKHASGKAVDLRISDLFPGDAPAWLAMLRVLCERMHLACFDESFAPGMGHVHVEIGG